jgi:hypothetical protein
MMMSPDRQYARRLSGRSRSASTGLAPLSRQKATVRVADQGENAVVAKQPGQETASNITTTDDQ